MYFWGTIMEMSIERRATALANLGNWFKTITPEEFSNLCKAAINQNNWFTKDNIQKAFNAWGEALTEEKIGHWIKGYNWSKNPRKVGLVLAGNIPLVGLHDVLSVIISGHKACVKYSSQDAVLMKAALQTLIDLEPELKSQLAEVDRLNDIEAVIATGSDNTARYFKHYFAKHPHIIRQNRVSVGLLNGEETTTDLQNLGLDIFTYYGLGCRNVAKIYCPKTFDLTQFIAAQDTHENVLSHHKYQNNYDYNKSVYLVNKEPHLDSGFFLMRESSELVSPISVVFYESYASEAELSLKLSAQQDKIQCIVAKDGWYEGSLPFGTAQCPELWDYADGVDTLEFLASL